MRFVDFIELVESNALLVERDVVNAPDIKQWVQTVAERVTSSTGKTWLKSQLFDYLINKADDRNLVQQLADVPYGAPDWLIKKMELGSPVYRINATDEFVNKTGEVVDWVNNWTNDNPNSRINYTWEQAVKESDAWHRELAMGANHGDETFDDDGIGTFYEYDDGYRWVDVQSEQCLKREGGRMGHCVGSYGTAVSTGGTKILSLRDPSNRPHVTIEVENPNLAMWKDYEQHAAGNPPKRGNLGVVSQVKGKQNRPPVPRYAPYVKHLFDNYGFSTNTGGDHDLRVMGYYYRQERLLPLKQVAKTIKKYNTGFRWVIVNDRTNSITDSGEIILTDGNWSRIMHGHFITVGDKTVVTYMNGITEDYAEYLMDLYAMTDDSFKIDLSSTELLAGKIYSGVGGIDRDPIVAAGYNRRKMIDGYQAIELYHKVYTDRPERLTPFIAKGDKVVGEIKKSVASNNGLEITQLVFYDRVPMNYRDLVVSAARAYGAGVENPHMLGLDDDLNPAYESDDLEFISNSTRLDYNYSWGVDHESIVVYPDYSETPIAIISVTVNGEFVAVGSGVYRTPKDHGVVGYAIIDLIKQGKLEDDGNESVIDALTEWGWGNSTGNGGDYYYSEAAENLESVWTQTDMDGNKMFSEQTKVRDIDEGILKIGDDYWEYYGTLAELCENGVYSANNYGYEYDDDDGGALMTNNTVELLPENRNDGLQLSYTNFSEDVAIRLINNK